MCVPIAAISADDLRLMLWLYGVSLLLLMMLLLPFVAVVVAFDLSLFPGL